MIKVQNLSKTFGEVKAVDDVTFEVQPGEIFAFLGPNGAGKTTTIQMLTTLLRPTSGTIAIDGLDPVAKPLEVRQRFGIVFQDPSLDQELTAYENMDLHGVLYHVPRKIRARAHRDAAQALRALGPAHVAREDVLGRHAAPARDRARPAAHAEDPVSRRADARPRSAEPQSALDAREAPERDRGRHGVPDDALHGRGGPRRAPHRDHRSRQDRRAAARAPSSRRRPAPIRSRPRS